MADPAEILSSLHGLRLPEPGLADLAAALAVGLCVAGLAGMVAGSFHKRRERRSYADRVAAIRLLPEPDRAPALGWLLQELTETCAPGTDAWTDRAVRHFKLDAGLQDLIGGLYRPGATIDTARLEQVVLKAARQAGG